MKLLKHIKASFSKNTKTSALEESAESNRDWIWDDNKAALVEMVQRVAQEQVEKYGPICKRCGWPIYHPVVQAPWLKEGETHDCFTGDPLAR